MADSRNVFRLGPVGKDSMTVGMECHGCLGGMGIDNTMVVGGSRLGLDREST